MYSGRRFGVRLFVLVGQPHERARITEQHGVEASREIKETPVALILREISSALCAIASQASPYSSACARQR